MAGSCVLCARLWTGRSDVGGRAPSDKGIWGLRLPVARIDSGGGPNLLSGQPPRATSARRSWARLAPLRRRHITTTNQNH